MLLSKKQRSPRFFFYISIVLRIFHLSFSSRKIEENHIREIYTGPLPVLTEYGTGKNRRQREKPEGWKSEFIARLSVSLC